MGATASDPPSVRYPMGLHQTIWWLQTPKIMGHTHQISGLQSHVFTIQHLKNHEIEKVISPGYLLIGYLPW